VDQLLIALDVPTGDQAARLAASLRGVTGGLKIGSRLFTSEGPDIVRRLSAEGDRIFLDLKFHDIPNTVADAVEAATTIGVWMVNVHASGGMRMMQAARNAAHDTAARLGRTPPLVIAVTVLTSMSGTALTETGVAGTVLEGVGDQLRGEQLSDLDEIASHPAAGLGDGSARVPHALLAALQHELRALDDGHGVSPSV